MTTITIAEKSIRVDKEPIVVLTLKKWAMIESELEDLEMYRSVNLAQEIAKRRKDKTTISIESVLKKYRI